ncbi:MAG: carbohydrate kinase [Bacteroidales bacterium]|nr:carbohydrate kinase [Bacteroidales bacterium]
MKFNNSKILCIGEVLWDNLPSGKKPGGAPMNVALHLHNIGQTVTIASKVGNDDPGRELLDFLQQSGVDTDLIGIDEALPTSQVLVHLDQNNNATYEICDPVAWDNLTLTPALEKNAAESGLFIFGSLASRNPISRATILRLLEFDALKLIDVNLRKPYDHQETVEKLLRKSDIAKLNDEELVTFAQWHNKHKHDEKSLIRWFAEEYLLSMVCVTRGDKGAVLYCDGNFYEHPGFKVDAVDTVGAGDAFLAGLIAALSEGRNYPDALAFASATGAFVASRPGATPAYDRDEINRILQSN